MASLPTGTVTLLFTDIEGSTRLLRELGDAYADTLARHRDLLRNAFAAHGGVEVDTQGDAFLVAFARAGDAAAAAAQAQRLLGGGPVRVRIGLHTGEPTLTAEGYVGLDVHRGARVAAAAHGGQVLLTESTRALLDRPVRALGPHRLKDFDEPVALYQLGDGQFPPPRTLHRVVLPPRWTRLVGRERELRELAARLGGERLVTLTGPGGSGKTRLALELAAQAADEFEHGVFFVPLAAVREPPHVLPAVAQVLGELGDPGALLSDRSALLVLDNFEQVAAAAPDVSSLLAVAPHVRGVVTSREPLHVSGERVYPVEPLPQVDAVRLFVERAEGVEASAVVEEICRRLDGLPLAIELAAARTRALDPAALLERLELALLTGGSRDLPDRQRTLRAAIEWSVDLLDDRERTLFERLGVFAGGFGLRAAEAVCEASLDELASLVEKSLVRRTGERYGLLETIRELARERLDDETRSRHAGWCLGLAREARPHLRGPDQGEWFGRLVAEEANLREALRHAAEGAKPEIGLGLIVDLEVFWHRRGHSAEGLRWAERVLAVAGGEPLLRARALGVAGHLATDAGELDLAEGYFAESLPVLRAQGDERAVAESLRGYGDLRTERGDPAGARRAFEEAIELFTRLGDLGAVSGRLNDLAYLALRDGERERARELGRRAIEVAVEAGDVGNVAGTTHSLGDVALEAGDPEAAEQHYREALRLAVALPHEDALTAACCAGLAAALARQSRGAEAGRCWAFAERVAERVGAPLSAGTPVDYRAHVTAALGEVETAVFDAARAAAQSVPLDDAIAEVGSAS